MIQCVLGIRKHLTIYQSYNKVCYDNSACFLMSLRTAYSFVLTDITLITSFIHTIYIQLASLFMINLSCLLNLKPWSKSFFFFTFFEKVSLNDSWFTVLWLLLYNSDSAMHVHTSIVFQISFPYRSLQSIGQSSLSNRSSTDLISSPFTLVPPFIVSCVIVCIISTKSSVNIDEG